MAARVFPGDRRVWAWTAVVGLPLLALLAWQLLMPRPFYTATDSIGPRSAVLTLHGGQRLCQPDVPLAAQTGRVQFSYGVLGPQKPVRMTVTLLRGGSEITRGTVRDIPVAPPLPTTFALDHPIPAGAPTTLGTVCLHEAAGGPPVAVAGYGGTPPAHDLLPRLDGKRLALAVSIWMLPPAGVQRSLIGSWATIMRRLSLFRPGFATPAFYWLLFGLGLPLLCYLAIRTLATATIRRRLGLRIFLLALAGAAIWAISTVPFDAPDESAHFAYAEYLAETGKAPIQTATGRSPYASDERLALGAIHQFSVITQNDTRTVWLRSEQRAYQRELAREHPPRDNGGGPTPATVVHSPLYYSTLIPGYELGRGGGTFDELFWMRMTSAVFGAIVALAAFLTLRELFPGRSELAVAGGLLVALEPQFSFIAGAVNNDNGVNAMAALAVYLTVRALRRGIGWRHGLALGVVLGLMPTMKATGLALYPAVALALAVVAVRGRSRGTALGLAAVLAGVAAVLGPWGLLAPTFHRSLFGVPGGIGVTGAASSNAAGQGLLAKLVYVWEVFLPRLPFMSAHWAPGHWPFFWIYIRRGFAAFGWYAVYFPAWVYVVVLLVLIACGLLTLDAARRLRRSARAWWPEWTFLLLVVVGVIGGVELAYYSPVPRPWYVVPEQGRYAFPAIVALVCLALAGIGSLKRPRATALLTALVVASVYFEAGSHLLYLVRDYT